MPRLGIDDGGKGVADRGESGDVTELSRLWRILAGGTELVHTGDRVICILTPDCLLMQPKACPINTRVGDGPESRDRANWTSGVTSNPHRGESSINDK